MLTNHEAQSLVNAAYEQAYADVMTKFANGDEKGEGFFKKTGQKIKGGYNTVVNKLPYAEKMGKGKHAVIPVLLAAGAGGAYAYNKSRKKKASAWDYDPYLMNKSAAMDDYGNEIVKGKVVGDKKTVGQTLKGWAAAPGNLVGKTPWIGSKLGAGKHAVIPVLAATGGGAYAYYKKKKKEASLFGDALYDLNYQVALAEEVQAWKEANGLV